MSAAQDAEGTELLTRRGLRATARMPAAGTAAAVLFPSSPHEPIDNRSRWRRALALGSLSVALLSLTLAPAGCGGSESAAPTHPARSPLPAHAQAPAIRLAIPVPSATRLEHEVTAFWSGHPALSSYAVQDVEYTPVSLRRVVAACTNAMPVATGSAQTESLLACAPLIYFLYSYGRQRDVAPAIDLADDIYSYAVSGIPESTDAAAILAGTLRGWGVPVTSAATTAPAPVNNPAEIALVRTTEHGILTAGAVRIVIKGYSDGSRDPVETISAQIGRSSSLETLAQGDAAATIRITPKLGYFSGNLAGLSRLIGLPSPTAARVRGRWIEVSKGSSEYTDLATEETIPALPASILPLGVSAVVLRHETAAGKPADVLSWRSTIGGTAGSGSGAELDESLDLSSTPPHLPESETTVVGNESQTVAFLDWGQPFRVQAPSSAAVVPLSDISGPSSAP